MLTGEREWQERAGINVKQPADPGGMDGAPRSSPARHELDNRAFDARWMVIREDAGSPQSVRAERVSHAAQQGYSTHEMFT